MQSITDLFYIPTTYLSFIYRINHMPIYHLTSLHRYKQVFVELCELKQSTYGPEWKETARWVKYEEDVEGVDANRWGKPHVAFLNFHSLFSLRKGLDRGKDLLPRTLYWGMTEVRICYRESSMGA